MRIREVIEIKAQSKWIENKHLEFEILEVLLDIHELLQKDTPLT